MSKHNFVSNRPPQAGSNFRSPPKSPPKPKFQVESKSDSKPGAGVKTYKSKFVPSRTGGLMAANRVDGRIVFVDKKGPQPLNNGKDFEFQIVGENAPKCSVYFAAIVLPETGPVRIEITKSGKMICLGRKRVPTQFRSSKSDDKPLAEYRSASPGDSFEPDPEEIYVDSQDQVEEDENERVDEEGNHVEDEDSNHLEDEAFLIFDMLRNKPVSCHSCGFEDCRCDGTGHDWVPYRTTVNVLA